MSLSIFYSLLATLPVGFLAIIVAVWRQFENAKGMEPPVKEGEKFLRAPGYSAFKKVEELNAELDDVLFWFICLPAVLVIAYLAFKLKATPIVPHFWQIVAVLSVAGFIWLTARLISLVKARRCWDLGFRGERAVGEYLNRLMLDGCQVFHDFPLSENGNLDHVVVAPSGVYAVETKTKSKCSKLEDNYRVVNDGKTLQFPGGSDAEKLAQARGQAARLGRVLTNELKIAVEAKPILTFPGWFVDNTDNPGDAQDVQVLNPKMIRSAIVTDAPPALSPEEMRRIAAYLDGKCRDVEF